MIRGSKRRQRRPNVPLRSLHATLLVIFVGYVFLIPVLRIYPQIRTGEIAAWPSGPLLMGEQVAVRFFEFLIMSWVFLVGASIGSFLNVVIYRSPRGMSLLGSSRCPYCRTAIRWHDNIPVFGWLQLRGRCRTCHLPISPRYPLVELAIGLLLLILALVEILWSGVNLPIALEGGSYWSNFSWLIRHPNWELVGFFVYHALLLCALFSWTRIVADGFRIPRWQLVLVLAAGLVIPWVQPAVHPILWAHAMPQDSRSLWDARLVTPLIGLGFGVGWGCLLAWAARGSQRRASFERSSIVCFWATIGLFLGWQAAIVTATLAGLTRLTATAMSGKWLAARQSLLNHAFLATTLQILLWRPMQDVFWSDDGQTTVVLGLGWAGLSLLMVWAASHGEDA